LSKNSDQALSFTQKACIIKPEVRSVKGPLPSSFSDGSSGCNP
jgi:hypothetical protein